MKQLAPLAALSALPMSGATLGAWLDERAWLGFTTWRSACRAAGFRFTSLIDFTFQLLPTAVLGLLAGGVLLLLLGFAMCATQGRRCLAAHVGCVITLPIGLLLCALAIPVQAMLLADIALAALIATWLVRSPSHATAVHP